MPRLPTNRRFRCVLCAGILILYGPACFFDLDLQLQNDPPECTNRSVIRASLVYPDSSVCTLSIFDRNDTAVSVSVQPCTTADFDEACTVQTVEPWPGSFEFLSTGYGEKRLHLKLGTRRMGRYDGILLLQDAAFAMVKIPYGIEKKIFDPFDAPPLDEAYWQPSIADDATRLGFDYTDGKLVFTFKQGGEQALSPASVEIRSRFYLPAAFHTAIDFKLRDEMDESFEIGFLISSSPDTGRWAGEQAGIFISGVNGRLRLEFRSINLQSYSSDISTTAGELGIGRIDSTISYYFHDGNPSVTPKPRASQIYPADLPVYIHIKMTVRNQLKERNCYWNDFSLAEGEVVFPENRFR